MKISKEYIFVMISGTFAGLIVFGWQIFTNLGLSLFEISTLPFIPILLILLPIIIRNKYRLHKKNIWPLFVFGAIGALVVLTEFGGLFFHVPVAVIVLLLYTQPLWTILLSPWLLRERIKWFHIVSCICVLWWIFFLAYPFETGVVISPIGITIWLLAGISLALRVMAGARVARKWIDPYLSKFTEAGFTVILLFLLYPVFLLITKDPSAIGFHINRSRKIWLLFFGFALFAETIPHICYLKWVKKLSAMTAGIILLLEPISAAILAMIFLKQPLTIYIVIGWILILLGNLFVMIYGQNKSLPTIL